MMDDRRIGERRRGLSDMPYTNHDKINELIEGTTDPVQRAMLLVLSGIARDLDSNTTATQQIANSFDKHTKAFEEHDRVEARDRAYLKGAWWAGVLFMTFVQMAGGWVLVRAISSNDTQDVLLRNVENRVIQLEADHKRIDLLEKSMKEKHP